MQNHPQQNDQVVTTSHDMYGDVLKFHKHFVPDTLPAGPRMLPQDMYEFRIRFMAEELFEFAHACGRYDIGDAADALVDLVYVALGTAAMMGLPWDTIWREVHEANMRKVRTESASASKRGSRFDVVKPEGWEPPDVAGIIKWFARLTPVTKGHAD